MQPAPTVKTSSADLIAETLLGRRPDSCAPFRPTSGGTDSTSFRLQVGTDQLLLAVKRRPGSPIGVYFHRRVKSAGLPVPNLVVFAPRGGPNGEACAVWEWVEGVPAEWGTGQPCPYDEAELGELLGRIHALRFDGDFGFLGDDLSQRTFALPDLAPTSPTWSGFFHCDRVARHYLQLGYLNPDEAALLGSWLERLAPELDRAPARLLHFGDIMHNGNLLVDAGTGRIRAILDYTESLAGDPRWELAWFRYYFADFPFNRPSFDLARFWAGYGFEAPADDSLSRFYLAAILLFEKLRVYDPASLRGQWALTRLKGIAREIV
jgi:aminoglycoside phosphotransferase (APT) family kinase protein